MKILLTAFALFLASASAAVAAPTLSWDPVTTDATGAPLGPGLEVKNYTVYRCPVNVNPCTVAGGTVAGTVTAPAVSLDLAGQGFPANFAVTATNIIAQSAISVSIKATPADSPKNLRLSRAEETIQDHVLRSFRRS